MLGAQQSKDWENDKKVSRCWSLDHLHPPQIGADRDWHHNASNSWLLENDLLPNNQRRFWYLPAAYSPH
jgi:hypothetical protein